MISGSLFSVCLSDECLLCPMNLGYHTQLIFSVMKIESFYLGLYKSWSLNHNQYTVSLKMLDTDWQKIGHSSSLTKAVKVLVFV